MQKCSVTNVRVVSKHASACYRFIYRESKMALKKTVIDLYLGEFIYCVNILKKRGANLNTKHLKIKAKKKEDCGTYSWAICQRVSFFVTVLRSYPNNVLSSGHPRKAPKRPKEYMDQHFGSATEGLYMAWLLR